MSLMVLGTASHVGKSTIVAAICRSLVNRGFRVAPFKSQNMSLNSYVTPDGCEIGIAQAIQAEAARLDPTADMNPILLKPRGDCISQVVLLGHPYRDVPVTEYYRETDRLLAKALEAASRLIDAHGHVVVEGAGGAAELNLYSRDIANIRLARALNIPIILVADIERGGVFAQVYGTIELLPSDIRPLVQGIIINKFRGDPGIFEEGVREIERLTGVPVLGVLPHMEIGLPSEDSLSLADKKCHPGSIRIGVLRHPRISNFTDFELLEQYVSVEYVRYGEPLDAFDCIILPGTKNTIEDLLQLVASGSAAALRRARENGVPIIGICGGYQMLGREITDSAGIESDEGRYEGLCLLDVTTQFDRYEKCTEQVCRRARLVPPILSWIGEVDGYEIHMGVTIRGDDQEAFEGDGACSADGLVFGTYMHGLFCNRSAIHALLSFLHQRKGVVFEPGDLHDRPDPYDALAAAFEAHVDIDRIISLCFRDSGNSPR
ncbi:MAG: cobyric acid synthase [Methanoregulaceae archaeon]|nr:cobyric acid synthase [Methanoregulaceae archaeon]